MSLYDEVFATLEDYAAAYCSKDIERLMGVFADNDSISVIGTGSDELCTGRDSIRHLFLRNFSEATATRFEWGWSDILVSDSHAVVSQCLIIHLTLGGELIKVPVRWSVVLKKLDRWVWLHRHASIASGQQKQGNAYPKLNIE